MLDPPLLGLSFNTSVPYMTLQRALVKVADPSPRWEIAILTPSWPAHELCDNSSFSSRGTADNT